MTEDDWQLLIDRIKTGHCTPFLGAGACADTLPLGADVARRWALRYGYPLEDTHDLAAVAQFLGVHRDDAMFPKDRIKAELEGYGPPDFTVENELHDVMAELPIPVFMTTNYDDFMTQALRRRGKDPKREICRWNRSPAIKTEPTVLGPSFAATPANPVVFHLHGHLGVPESLVLTEDDYLDFLVAISRDESLLPHQIQKALAGASLMFVGYRLSDWDFRVIHRGLVMSGEASLRRLSVTVQLRPADPARQYLDKYFGALKVRVYWGDAREFARELRTRWHASLGDG